MANQKFTTGQRAKNKWQWSSGSHVAYLYCHTHIPPSLRKIEGASGQGGLEKNSVFWAWRGCSTHEHAAVVGHKDLHNTKPSYHGMGRGSEDPNTEKLLAVDGFWGRENQLPLRIWSLICRPCSRGWPHAHEDMYNTR